MSPESRGDHNARRIPVGRQSQIMERIDDGGMAGVEELAAEFGVSVATVRRDLRQLELRGVVHRVFGGAVSASEISYASRIQAHVDEKKAIGARAAALVGPMETVALETGTTVLAVARALRAPGLVLVTNSVDVLLVVQGRADTRVLLTGGNFDSRTRCLYGDVTEQFYADRHVDRLFLGAGSLSLEGLRDSNIDGIGAKRSAIRAARESVVVADSSKFRLGALSVLCDWSEIDVLVTDGEAPNDVLDVVRSVGVRVILA